MNLIHRLSVSVFVVTIFIIFTGCTTQTPESFRFLQREETFQVSEKINTEIDLLWVVDNSSSMEVVQEKMRTGFRSFVDEVASTDWEVRTAVITTDTYLAHSEFSAYLGSTIPGGGGVKYGDLAPSWGPGYATLVAGIHDGPRTALCSSLLPHFIMGPSQCLTRDMNPALVGVDECVSPSPGTSSTVQCVNTVNNNTVHSGKSVITMKRPETGIEAWKEAITRDFSVNVSVGITGHGSERGFSSLLKFIQDNESGVNKFFRPGALHAVIFVSDEDDQSMKIPSTPSADFNPFSNYRCDQVTLVNDNSAAVISGAGGFCCEGVDCRFKPIAGGCSGGVSICPEVDELLSVETVKESLESFFSRVDSGESNYLVSAIVPSNDSSVSSIAAARAISDAAVGGIRTRSTQIASRYISLAQSVSNGSAVYDIGEENYSEIMREIGRTIILKKGTFKLKVAATSEADTLVKVLHSDGSSTAVAGGKFKVNGNTVVLQDEEMVLGLAEDDRVSINYQPVSAY